MFCHNCGCKLPEDARFCFNCGAEQLTEEPAAMPEPAAEPSPAELYIPDYEPELPQVRTPEPEEPEEPEVPEEPEEPKMPQERDGAFTVRLPGEQGTFTWEHVTISGEFTGGKGTITIHFE